MGYLWDMLQACRAVATFVSGRTYTDYEHNLLLRSGVERQIEIIGEAARHVSPEFRHRHAEFYWSGIIAQRHVLAHEYGEIKHERIWRVATEFVPQLTRQLENLDIPSEIDDRPPTTS